MGTYGLAMAAPALALLVWAAVEDLRSKNGTTVQNQPISGLTILADGDEIEFGHVKGWFIVETTDDPPTTTHL